MSEVVWLAMPGLRILSSRTWVASSPMYWPGWLTEVRLIPGSSARLELSKLITDRSAGMRRPRLSAALYSSTASSSLVQISAVGSAAPLARKASRAAKAFPEETGCSQRISHSGGTPCPRSASSSAAPCLRSSLGRYPPP